MPRITHTAACETNGCPNRAQARGTRCPSCYHRLGRTGDIRGRLLRDGELRPHRATADMLLKRYASRPAVKAALRWADSLLQRPFDGSPLSLELHRLRTQGVTAGEVVAAVVAVFGYHEGAPHRLPDNATLTYNAANAVLRLRHRPSIRSRNGSRSGAYVSAKVRRPLGLALRETLGPFARGMLDAYGRELKAEADLKRTIANFAAAE